MNLWRRDGSGRRAAADSSARRPYKSLRGRPYRQTDSAIGGLAQWVDQVASHQAPEAGDRPTTTLLFRRADARYAGDPPIPVTAIPYESLPASAANSLPASQPNHCHPPMQLTALLPYASLPAFHADHCHPPMQITAACPLTMRWRASGVTPTLPLYLLRRSILH